MLRHLHSCIFLKAGFLKKLMTGRSVYDSLYNNQIRENNKSIPDKYVPPQNIRKSGIKITKLKNQSVAPSLHDRSHKELQK